MEVHTTERTRHFLVKKPKKILQLRLEDKNVFNAIHLNSIGYVFEFGEGCGFTAVRDAVEDYDQGINLFIFSPGRERPRKLAGQQPTGLPGQAR